MGRANRLISNFAELILLSFENTENIKLKQKEKTVFTGLPLRDRITKYSSNENKEDNTINILVLGGQPRSKNIHRSYSRHSVLSIQRNKRQAKNLSKLCQR